MQFVDLTVVPSTMQSEILYNILEHVIHLLGPWLFYANLSSYFSLNEFILNF